MIKPIKKKKSKTLSQLDKKLWDLFARYIKLRDIVDEDGEGLFGFCCTCKKKLYVQYNNGSTNRDAQAGHYIPRGYKNTKYNELNVHLQCGMPCNSFRHGDPLGYEDFLIKKYSQTVLDNLKQFRRDYLAGNYQKLDRIFYNEAIETYKDKVKELEEGIHEDSFYDEMAFEPTKEKSCDNCKELEQEIEALEYDRKEGFPF